MTDLGDLTGFLRETSVSNLDWLDVDEEGYRELDALPKQNLDIAPDLEAMWRHKNELSSNFVPNTGAPRTMRDLGLVHTASEEVVRTARLAIMQTTDPLRIKSILASRYDGTALVNAKTALASVFAERGLLGRFYIDASDFPNCDRSKSASEFVRKYAAEAKYVLTKEACGGCTHRKVLHNGASHCGVFHKELRPEIPYTEGLASEVEQLQRAKGKTIQASVGAPKARIQRAFLAEASAESAGFSGHQQIAPVQKPVDTNQVLIAAESLTNKRDAAEKQRLAEVKARPIVAMLRNEMLKGRTEAELIHSLRLAFDLRDLEETKSEWAPLFRQAGLYGAVYTTQDSFADCREGADFIHKHASKVRVVVAGSKCGSCIFNQINRCMMYGRPLVASAEEVFTSDTVQAVLDEHRIAGKLPNDAPKMRWGSTPVEALKAIHKAASMPVASAHTSLRSSIETAFHGTTRQAQTSLLTKREILRTASRYMNEGLYGDELLQVLKGRFDPRDILAAGADLKQVLAEQGLQGIKFVDPSVYDDYGNGCKEAARLHRARSAVQYLKIGNKCGSCVHHTRPGHCSVINKQLVVEPPYMDKLAEQQAILASGASSEVSYESLMNNGLTMMQEYQLQHREASIELDPERRELEASFQFGSQEIKL